MSNRIEKDSKRLRDKEYLRWLSQLPCAICGRKDDTVVGHHVRTGNAGGGSLKPGDDRCLPLCHTHHMELHNYPLGEQTYLDMQGVDYEEKTKEYYMEYCSKKN